jgi:succinate dehydrogenase / fumarate reductase membrane anchor subunit
MDTPMRHITFKPSFDVTVWKYMRLSGILLVPLVWVHTILNTLIIGSENIDLAYVSMRWASLGWRIYDILLLIFAFSHGISGLRQILFDFAESSAARKVLNLLMLLFWLILSFIGAVSIIGGIGE